MSYITVARVASAGPILVAKREIAAVYAVSYMGGSGGTVTQANGTEILLRNSKTFLVNETVAEIEAKLME